MGKSKEMTKITGIIRLSLTLAIICTLSLGVWAGVRAQRAISFNINCEAYIKRAADANTVDMAKTELAKAIQYAEENELTEGIVSIILKDPKNDIGYWYENMKASYEELDSLPEDATSLEKTNVLMKLRESLTDDSGESGVKVTHPMGISIYPYNTIFFLWSIVSLVGAAVFWMVFLRYS